MGKEKKAPQVSSAFLKDAIADATAMREMAIATVKDYLVEGFEPRITNMLKTKLKEEDDELEDEIEDDEEVEVEQDEEEFEDEEEEEIEFEDEEEFEDDEEDIDIEAAIKELEGEDDEFEDEDEDEDLELEIDLVDEEDEDEFEDDEEDEEIDYEALRKENKELKETVYFLKDKLTETNLLNAKLHYTQKLQKKFKLSEHQKATVLDGMDRSKSLREVQQTFVTLGQSFKPNVILKKKRISSASEATKRTKKDSKIITEVNDKRKRLQVLAGIK